MDQHGNLMIAPLPPLDAPIQHGMQLADNSSYNVESQHCWPYQCSFYNGLRSDSILSGWNWEQNKVIIFIISGCAVVLLLTLALWFYMAFFGKEALGPQVSTLHLKLARTTLPCNPHPSTTNTTMNSRSREGSRWRRGCQLRADLPRLYCSSA